MTWGFIHCQSVLAEKTTLDQKETASKSEYNSSLIQELKKLANQGRMMGCEFPIGTNKETVLQAWGEPDKVEFKYFYLYKKKYSYKKTDVTLTFDSNNLISAIEVRYPPIKNLILSDVEKALGAPEKNVGFDFMVYKLCGYKLIFVPERNYIDGSDKISSVLVKIQKPTA
jgi:hypothetical protein